MYYEYFNNNNYSSSENYYHYSEILDKVRKLFLDIIFNVLTDKTNIYMLLMNYIDNPIFINEFKEYFDVEETDLIYKNKALKEKFYLFLNDPIKYIGYSNNVELLEHPVMINKYQTEELSDRIYYIKETCLAAIENNDINMIDHLPIDYDDNSFFYACLRGGSMDIIKYVASKYKKIPTDNPEVFNNAVISNNIELLNFLKKNNYKYEKTAFYNAIINNCKNSILWMKENNLLIYDSYACNCAALYDQEDMLFYLIHEGFDYRHQSIMKSVVLNANFELFKKLVKMKASYHRKKCLEVCLSMKDENISKKYSENNKKLIEYLSREK